MEFVHRRNCKDTKRTRQPSEYLALLFLSNTSREGCGITDKVCTIPAVFYPCLPHPPRKKAHKSPFLLNRSLYDTTFKSPCQGVFLVLPDFLSKTHIVCYTFMLLTPTRKQRRVWCNVSSIFCASCYGECSSLLHLSVAGQLPPMSSQPAP